MPLVIWSLIILVQGDILNPTGGEFLGLFIMYFCGIPLTTLILFMIKKGIKP
jgi:hypothetical protein